MHLSLCPHRRRASSPFSTRKSTLESLASAAGCKTAVVPSAAAHARCSGSAQSCCQDDCCSTPSSSTALHHPCAVAAQHLPPLRPASGAAQMDNCRGWSAWCSHRHSFTPASARRDDRQLKDSRRRSRITACLEDEDKRRRHDSFTIVGLEPPRRPRGRAQKIRRENVWEGLLPAR